ncbi:hypothetical protein ACOME3_010284 [Neoechinorhynchus agilis]
MHRRLPSLNTLESSGQSTNLLINAAPAPANESAPQLRVLAPKSARKRRREEGDENVPRRPIRGHRRIVKDVVVAMSDCAANLVAHVPSELSDDIQTLNCSSCLQSEEVNVSNVMDANLYKCSRCKFGAARRLTTAATAAINKQLSRTYLQGAMSAPADRIPRLQEVDCCCRSIVLDWMSDVCMALQLTVQTYYLAVCYFDRILVMFAQPKYIRSNHMQSIACACLFLACKIEETDRAPTSADFCTISDNACTRQHLKQIELKMVSSLDWKLRPITADCCLLYLCQLKIHEEKEIHQQHEQQQQLCACNQSHCKQRKISGPKREPLAPLIGTTSYSNTTQQFRHQRPPKHGTNAEKFNQTARYYSMCTQHQFDAFVFNEAIKIMNLAIMDIGWMCFSGIEIAVSALTLIGHEDALDLTELDHDRVNQCVQWLRPFHKTLKEEGFLRSDAQRSHNAAKQLTSIPERFFLVQVGAPRLSILKQVQKRGDYENASSTVIEPNGNDLCLQQLSNCGPRTGSPVVNCQLGIEKQEGAKPFNAVTNFNTNNAPSNTIFEQRLIDHQSEEDPSLNANDAQESIPTKRRRAN